MRVNKMHRDEKIDEVGSVTSGQTLLDKIRDEDQTANLTVFEKEKRLKSQQHKMRKMIKTVIMSVEERQSEAACEDRIPKTGNVVIDKINQ